MDITRLKKLYEVYISWDNEYRRLCDQEDKECDHVKALQLKQNCEFALYNTLSRKNKLIEAIGDYLKDK